MIIDSLRPYRRIAALDSTVRDGACALVWSSPVKLRRARTKKAPLRVIASASLALFLLLSFSALGRVHAATFCVTAGDFVELQAALVGAVSNGEDDVIKLQAGHFAFFPARTADAIASGALNALAGAVERMHRYLREAGQPSALIVVSGGGADLLAPQLNAPAEVVDNLVLEGLIRIALEKTPSPHSQ